MENDTVSNVLRSIVDNGIKLEVENIFQEHKVKAIRDLEVALESAKINLLTACAVEIRSRLEVDNTDTVLTIRIKNK